jgi:hypothetical protein
MEVFIKDRFKISKRSKTPEGYLVIEANRIARPGILNYKAIELGLTDREPMDTVKVYRDESVLFSPEVMDSFKNKPVTLEHPPVMLDLSNVTEYQKGFTKEDVTQDNGFLTVSMVVQDKKAIEAIESGSHSEISAGYKADINFRDAEDYDAVMDTVKGNHVALVERGRNGREVRVSDHEPKTQTRGKGMELVAICFDGLDLEVTPHGKKIIEKLQAIADSAEAKTAEVESAKTAELEAKDAEYKAQIDTLQAKLDDAKSKILSNEDLEKCIEARSALKETVSSIISDFDFSGKSEEQIKKEVIEQHCKVDVTDKSADYVNARFDALCEVVKNSDPYKAPLSADAKDVTDATYKPASQIAREAKIEANRKRWNEGDAE